MAQRDLKVTLIGDDKTGGAFGSAGKNAEGFGSKMKDVGKFAAVAFGGAVVAGVAGFGAALVAGAKDAANMERLLAQTSAVVKSTGGAANVSTAQIESFANSIEKATGIEAENVIEGQNMLLTFTNIKNGVGEGNQVFDQASSVLTDMSTAMGTDMSSSAVLLGKALNDPIAGVGALSKAGVQLTDAQKEQIKGFVESGDAMSAQKIILGELTTQFGGSAAAFGDTLPGQIAKAKNAFGDLFESLAVNLLPTVSTIVTSFTAAIPVALGYAQTAFAAVGDWWAVQGPAISAAATTLATTVVAAFQTVGGAVMATVGFFREHDTAARALGVVIAAVMAGVMAAWVAQAGVATVNAARSVVAWFATATASTTSATIQSKSTAQIVVGWVAHAAGATVNAAKVVAGWVATGAGAIASAAVMAAQVARQVASWALLGAQSLLHAAKVAAAWLIAMGPIALVVAAVVGLVVVVVRNWDTIRAKTAELWNTVKTLTSAAWSALTAAVSSGVSTVVGFITGLPGRILGAVGGFGTLLLDAGRRLMEGLARGIGEKIEAVVGKVRDAVSLIGRLLPGSPIKDGPLKSWNGGGAGKRLMGMLAGGIVDGQPDVRSALTDALDVGGMRLGGSGYINSRLAATASGAPSESSRVSHTDALLREQNALLRELVGTTQSLPAGYRFGERKRNG